MKRLPPPPDVPKAMRSGVKHRGVTELKVILRDLGYYKGDLKAFYGNDLRNAVANFQRANDITITGHFTDVTREALVRVTGGSGEVPSEESDSSSPSSPTTPQGAESELSSPPTNSSSDSPKRATTSASSSVSGRKRSSSKASKSTRTTPS